MSAPPSSTLAPPDADALGLACVPGVSDMSVLSVLANGFDSVIEAHEHGILRFFGPRELAVLCGVCREMEHAVSIAPIRAQGFRLTVLDGWLESRVPKARVTLLDLSGLGLHFGPALPALLAAALPGMAALRSLSVAHCSLDDWEMASIAAALPSLPALRCLDVSENLLGPAGLGALAGALRSMRALEELRQVRNQLGYFSIDFAALVPALPLLTSLKKLDLSGNQMCDVDHVHALAGALRCMAELEELNLESNFFGNGGTTSLSVDALPFLSSLKTLVLGCNKIGDAGVGDLAAALSSPSAPPLARLDLSRNHISNVGATFLAAALPSMAHLRSLDMQHHFGLQCGPGRDALIKAAAVREGCTLSI